MMVAMGRLGFGMQEAPPPGQSWTSSAKSDIVLQAEQRTELEDQRGPRSTIDKAGKSGPRASFRDSARRLNGADGAALGRKAGETDEYYGKGYRRGHARCFLTAGTAIDAAKRRLEPMPRVWWSVRSAVRSPSSSTG